MADRELTAQDTRSERRLTNLQRIIGATGSAQDGPLLVVIAGAHGNEPAGVIALQRVLDRVGRDNISMRGRLVALTGNLEALGRGDRYVDRDLNRMWDPEQVAVLRTSEAILDDIEQSEQRRIIDIIESELENHRGAVTVLDLHSTSATSPPFCIVGDTLQNRRIAFALCVPVILGLEETISGTIQEYYGERGLATAAIEGGQHEDPATVDHLESALWITLSTIGLVGAEASAYVDRHRQRLRNATHRLPAVVEVVHRHEREDNDGFSMREGFQSFSSVRKGEVLAHDNAGEIRAGLGGMLILPSYQTIGDDGFFVGRRVRRFWLRLSALLRRLRLDRLLPLLPGVRRHPTDAMVLLADPGITRWMTLNIFHLFGLRKYGSERGYEVFRRRREGPP